MPVAALTTLGCKVNQYETERIAEDFANAGFTLTDFDAPADVYVINSCSVTASADKKSRYLARKASRHNPNAVVVMTGCHSQQVIDAREEDGTSWVEGATLLVPNHEKMQVFAKVLTAHPEIMHYSSSVASLLPARPVRTRQTLKVQDGCEHFCGFCQIPHTRKVLVSRPWKEVVDEARLMGEQGTKEIVVTGVCVGAYNAATGSGGPELAELLLRVADQPGIARVRLSSIQPIEVTEELIEAFATHPNLCPHLHLSCQSGDDTILKAMNRPYDTQFYKNLVSKLREKIPNVAITTDLIVGYPGESEEMHANTCQFATEVAFQRTHVFSYSPRPKTYAETLVDDVPYEEKKRRHKELQHIVDTTNQAFTTRYLGQTLPVLIEGKEGNNGRVSGHTPHYIKVSFEAPAGLMGQIVPVQLGTKSLEDVSVQGAHEGTFGTLALSELDIQAHLRIAPQPKFESLVLPIAE
jgi:threonylcarbamoyladenosine tRNA methylthiotransferase MtaB